MYLRVSRKSMICSVHVRVVANSEPKGGSLDGTLFLGAPVNWHLVGKVEDACDRSPRYNVMVEVGVNEVRQGHMFTPWGRPVLLL